MNADKNGTLNRRGRQGRTGIEPPSHREKQRHYNRTAKIAKDAKKNQLLRCMAKRGLHVASGTAAMNSSKNGDIPGFSLLLEFIGVYRRSSAAKFFV
jgi:hypothetical protein